MDAHNRIASIWSYNEVVELGDCLKTKGNEKSPLLYGVLILNPPFRTLKCLQFNKYCKATQILAAKCDIAYYCCLPFQLPIVTTFLLNYYYIPFTHDSDSIALTHYL